MGEISSFAGRLLRPAHFGIVGFGTVSQVHCRYLLSEEGIGSGDASIMMVFPGIHDSPGDSWPPTVTDSLFKRAVANAALLFVEESVSCIQPMPGREGGGYIVETSHHCYRFESVYLEPATMHAA